MVDPNVILWTSVQWKGWFKAFLYKKGGGVKAGIWYINYGVIPLLYYVKNSYLFDKFVIEMVAL